MLHEAPFKRTPPNEAAFPRACGGVCAWTDLAGRRCLAWDSTVVHHHSNGANVLTDTAI